MKGNKIVATIVVLIMLFSTMMVLNKLDINFVEKASATMGVDDWQGSPDGSDILNMTEPDLVYGTTRTLTFNGTLITANSQIYYPTYHSEWDSGSSKYEVWTNWTQYPGVSLGASASEPSASVDLDYAGLWIVAASISPEFWKVNMSNMSIYEDSAWENIIGWFWVNASSWTVEVTPSSGVYYGKNESITITVKDGAGDPITDAAFVDIWNIADGAYSLRYHYVLPSTANGVWTITGENMYKDIWHNKGAGVYTVSAYADVSPGHTEATLIYGESGDSDYNGIRGYNTTFGNTTHWANRFLTSPGATTTQIRGWNGNPVLNTTWIDTTYKWESCGPFNPPEYWADYTNFTVKAGVPSITVTNSSQFWNSSATEEVKLTVDDYDSNNLTFSMSDVNLYNKSNNPSRSGSSPINSDYYNVTVSEPTADTNLIKITPNGTGDGNRWGWNRTTGQTWAAKGKIYIVIAKNSAGNDSEEWNGTAEMTLTTPAAEFKWIDDDGTYFTDDNTDGVIPSIPVITEVPLAIQFQLVGSDYTYWGDTNAGETELQAKENITISGDSIFTGTLDKMPNVDFSGTTWTVPIIPTMGSNGGEITITAQAWNKTITETLSIGGTNYWQNGSVVTVTPNEFNIDAENKTLDINVEWANGGSNRGATVYLYYIDDGTVATDGDPINGATKWVDKITADENGIYSMGFNRTQQTTNQTEQAGLGAIKAPRNLTIYVTTGSGGSGYGYARVSMLPMNDLEVEIYPTTFMAGYEYDYFYINTTFVGNTSDTPSTETADLDIFYVQIYDSEGNDVTDTLLNAGGYTSTDLDGDYTLELSSVYITEPGIYTVYAFNNTHDSTDHNATFEVKQVEVTCDMSPFIWMDPNDNISATFTVTYEGNPVNGTLRIDNMSFTTDYNKTYTNTSFDGSDDANTGNDSIEIDEDDIINGVVTINDITADYLPPNRAMENITFWFLPESPYDAAFARAIGRVPVQVPTVTPDHEYISVGRTTTVNIAVTGRGDELLPDVFVALNGQGIDQNGTSGADGKVTFSLLPTQTGDIAIDVGEDGRTVDTVITVTSWVLDISTDPISQVDEGDTFTVTVIKEGTTTAVEGASVKFSGVTQTTDDDGMTTFTAPMVTSDRTFAITVTAIGYAPDPDGLTITVINIPRLIIVIPDKVKATATFEVAVADDTGGAIVGAIITFNEKTYTTGVNGVAKLTAPKTKGDYPIEATFGNYVPAPGTVTVVAAAGVPGFELLSLIAALGVAFILFRRRRK